ncbi:unnamed protein product [Fusarium equiseti]|uniref:Uncharacterized protein n=2 Tax=Fusarium incarnatum-equiseti species complex TaxID=450425 RepID=A0A8J2NLR3_FUSEQ|nr:unnamed protein product [Fusarium equiseti]
MMQAQPQPQGRARSNSLQQMLDLEKKLNFQRTHQGSVPPSPPCTDSGSSVPPSPGPTPRRFELVPKDKKPPVRNYSAVPPPLFSSHSDPVRSASPNMIPRKPVGQGMSRPSSNEQLSKEKDDKPAQKTVAFCFPPDVEERRSMCQSPTWEAYNRQKKEKKEEKRKELEKKEEERRKEKEKEREQTMNAALEEAWKNAPKPRGRKLSKPMPPSPGRSNTEPVPAPAPVQQKRRSRSSSLLGFSIGRNNDDPEEPRRSRSSSLTSIFRKSFEIKRASFDETSSTGFLGGVKLEKKKEDFHLKVKEDQAKGDSKVHPAMRKTFLGHGSFTPLKVNPQTKEADAQKRAYPPISINTSGARGQSAKSPKSSSRRGSVNIYLWSARARRGSVSDDCAVDDTEDEGDQNKPQTPDSEILYHKAQGLIRRGGLYVKKGQNGEAETEDKPAVPTPRTSNQSLKQTPTVNVPKDSDNPPKQDTITVSRPPIASAQYPPRKSSIASTLSVPPTPPRRSSKRRGSLTLLTRLNHQPSPDEPSTAPAGSKASRKNNPPSIRYEQTQAGARPKPITAEAEPAPTKWNLKEAARSAFGRGHSAQGSVSSTASSASKYSQPSPPVASGPFPPRTDSRGLGTANSAPIRTQHVHVPVKHLTPPSSCSPTGRRPMTSSSESSYSDAIQSISPLSTPHSTPPQSEMGHSPNIASAKPTNWSYTNSPRMTPSEDPEIDPIQEAANRVMEAFSNANTRSATPRSPKQTPSPSPSHPLKHKDRSLRSPIQGHRSTLSDPEAGIKTLRRQSNLEHLNHGEPSAKMFVECCACMRYHDMPSKLYEAMSNPDEVLSAGYAGTVSMTVKCPWCKHEMSTKCCAGFAAMVYIKERFH